MLSTFQPGQHRPSDISLAFLSPQAANRGKVRFGVTRDILKPFESSPNHAYYARLGTIITSFDASST